MGDLPGVEFTSSTLFLTYLNHKDEEEVTNELFSIATWRVITNNTSKQSSNKIIT
jgi:hypothetical protein